MALLYKRGRITPPPHINLQIMKKQLPQILQQALALHKINTSDIADNTYYDFSLWTLNIVDNELLPLADLAAICIVRNIPGNSIATGTQANITAPDNLFIGAGSLKGILLGKDLKKILKKLKHKYIYHINTDINYILPSIFKFVSSLF